MSTKSKVKISYVMMQFSQLCLLFNYNNFGNIKFCMITANSTDLDQTWFLRRFLCFSNRHFEENHNFLNDLQCGFQERRSCETRFIQLVQDLTRSLTQAKQTDLILPELRKAYYKVNHLKLLYKMQMHGIQG